MFKKFGLVFILLASAVLANAQTETNRYPRQRQFIPDQIVYRTLFHTINLLNEKAEEAESRGINDIAQNYQRAFRQDFELSDQSSATLNRIASGYETAVREVDAKAHAILRERRKYYPNNKLPEGKEPLASSPELAALQQERDSLAVQYAARLREALGDNDEWQQFDKLVLTRIEAGIKPTNSTQTAKFVKTSAVKAQSGAQSVITGSTLISYNAYSNTVTSVSTTDLDYAAQDYYSARVSSILYDSNNNRTSGTATDTQSAGTASVTLQMPGQDQMTYSAKGTYNARVDIQDYAQGVRYIDRWNFQQVSVGGEGGYSYWLYLPFYGWGPLRYTSLRNLGLGSTSPVIVQAKPIVKTSKPTVAPAIVTVNNSIATVSTTISATTNGLQEGDVAVVEVYVQDSKKSLLLKCRCETTNTTSSERFRKSVV